MTSGEFAVTLVAAWNAHDLDAVVSHYHPDAEVTSPIAAAHVPGSFGTVRGVGALRMYWGAAIGPGSRLRLDLVDVLETLYGCTILSRDHRGHLVAETVVRDREGLVTAAVVACRP